MTGSGVSIVKVNSSTSYERIDGTSLGGGMKNTHIVQHEL